MFSLNYWLNTFLNAYFLFVEYIDKHAYFHALLVFYVYALVKLKRSA